MKLRLLGWALMACDIKRGKFGHGDTQEQDDLRIQGKIM